jgi:hypothetical protein
VKVLIVNKRVYDITSPIAVHRSHDENSASKIRVNKSEDVHCSSISILQYTFRILENAYANFKLDVLLPRCE